MSYFSRNLYHKTLWRIPDKHFATTQLNKTDYWVLRCPDHVPWHNTVETCQNMRSLIPIYFTKLQMTTNIVYSFFSGLFFLFVTNLLPVAAQANDSTGTPQNPSIAIFAGGCFWCVESDFDHVDGVISTVSGYTGGTVPNPTYQEVSAGRTGHLEAVQIEYNPNIVSYEMLLKIFWRSVDPTDDGGQFCDRGESYKTAIFTSSKEEKTIAEFSKASLEASRTLDDPVVTTIAIAGPFFRAEEYHQDYYTKNPIRYKFYRFRCGRDSRIRELWGASAFSGIKKQ